MTDDKIDRIKELYKYRKRLEKIICPLCGCSHLNTKLEICSECYFKLPQENREIIICDLERINS